MNYLYLIWFKEQLKKHRLVDDRIMNTLNSSLPTISFPADRTAKCADLYQQVGMIMYIYQGELYMYVMFIVY